MEKDEELKNSELQQEQENEEMEGEGYDIDEFDDQEEGMDPQMDMEGEGEMYDPAIHGDMQNPYNANDAIRNTFYPPQNPMMGSAYGGALRPVSANVMKQGGRRGIGRGKNGKKNSAFSRGIDNDFDVRTRPRNFLKDKEGLYDDAIKLKKANNNLK